MRYVVLFACFILAVSLVSAQDLTDYESLWLKVNFSNELKITHKSADYSVEDLSAILAWFPRENHQTRVQFTTTDPKADFMNDALRYRWEYPTRDTLSLAWTSQVNISRQFKPIYDKVSFPLVISDRTLGEFLLPQDIIDASPDITELAASLSEGDNDLYSVVFKTAEWVRTHVNYNMTTLTVDASQKASWVLKNRQGVCDEITSLFIALVRSLGIPARFVAGLAYTNLPDVEKSWGPHGWAEVYFPDFGWVPFDVTYGEYGWLDAGHIKLDDSLDSKKNTITYTLRGSKADVASKGINWDVSVLEKGRLAGDLLDLKFSPYAKKVGFGSYNLVTLEAENKENYYITSKFHLYKTEGVDILGERDMTELFKPLEQKKLRWLIKVSDDLKSDYEYTYPLRVDSTWGGARSSGFQVESGETQLPSGLFTSLIGAEEEAGKKPYSKIVDVMCNSDKEKARLGEVITVYCNLSNHGDTVLKSVRVCLEDDCQRINIGAGSQETVTFVKSFESSLASVLVIRIENANISKAAYVRVNVIAEPKLNITLTSIPSVMEFEEISPIKFIVARESQEVAKNVTVSVSYKYGQTEWLLNELQQPFEFDLKIHGARLDFDNDFLIKVDYKDDFGVSHSKEQHFKVQLVNTNIPQSIQVYVSRMAFWLDRFFRGIF